MLCTYAVPCQTTAGNSIKPEDFRLQTVRNGGRTLIPLWTWVRAGFAP